MSRAIKVEDQVYEELDLIKEKGETFSQVVGRLLEARLLMLEVIVMVEGVLRYEKWKQEKILKAIQEQQAVRSG